MSLNDPQMLNETPRSVHLHSGIANPTASNAMDGGFTNPNFANAPNSLRAGAGAGPEFQESITAQRNFNESPGVVEARPGIIESSNIDPLNENSNKDDGWANVPGGPGRTSTTKKPTSFAAGAMKLAYGHVTGNEEAKQAGREAVHGNK